jgi:hypothetical protein
MSSYTVLKTAGTHSDVLAAFGLADLLQHLDPRLVDLGDRFEVRLRRRLLPSDLAAADPGFSYLEKAKESGSVRVVKSARTPRIVSVSVSENRMYSILGRMNAHRGPNLVVARYAKLGRAHWAQKVWECLHGRPDFVFTSPLVQLFNPHAARGYARLKPDGTNRSDKTKNQWAEPFLEWLRFRGYFGGSAGWFATGNVRLFSPIPGDVSYQHLVHTAAAFRDLRLGGTAVKIDCRAVLGFTRLLIESAPSYCRPSRAVSGIWVTHYKNMGQAYTLMAMEQLAIPDWFDLRTSRQAQCWLESLEEHDTVLRRLADSHSDEFALLKQYRRTFQNRWQESLAEFLEFLAGYGLLLFKKRAQDHWVLPQFSVSSVTPILNRDPDLRVILRNPGFLAVAAAIRSSTLSAQAARHNGKLRREIRYGLLAEIRQAGLVGGQELRGVISSFVSSFNGEGARLWARGLRAASIHETELTQFAGAVGQSRSAATASALLIGLASCRRSQSTVAEVEAEMAQAVPA